MWSALIVPADRSQENTRHKVVPLSQAPCRFRPACCAQAHGPTGRPHACERRMLTFRMFAGSSLATTLASTGLAMVMTAIGTLSPVVYGAIDGESRVDI